MQSQTNRKGPNGHLHAHIEELCHNAAFEAAIACQIRKRLANAGHAFCRSALNLAFRISRNRKQRKDTEENVNHDMIGFQRMLQHFHFISSCLHGIHAGQLCGHGFAFLEDEVFPQKNAGNGTNRLKGLADVQAQRSRFLRAKHCAIRIDRGFQKAQADSNGKDGHEEHRVRCHMRSGEEQAAAGNVEAQTAENRRLISSIANDHRGRNRNQKITAVKRTLHQSTGKVAQGKHALKLRDEHII